MKIIYLFILKIFLPYSLKYIFIFKYYEKSEKKKFKNVRKYFSYTNVRNFEKKCNIQ